MKSVMNFLILNPFLHVCLDRFSWFSDVNLLRWYSKVDKYVYSY
jgi:hypothetical protein